jgi:hypothetical protein
MIIYNVDDMSSGGTYDGYFKIIGTGILTRMHVMNIVDQNQNQRIIQLDIGGDFTGVEKMNDLNMDSIIFSPRSLITTLPDSCFQNGTMLEVLLPLTLTEIPMSCFLNCENLTYTAIPDTVTTVGKNSYFNCKSLVEIAIPSKVMFIDDAAFANCGRLRKTEFAPNSSLKELGDQVFVSTSLVSLDLPPSLTKVGSSIVSIVPTLKAMAMNRSIWASVHSFLAENKTRYIYFHNETVIYINQSTGINDLVVDTSGDGEFFFNMATIILVINLSTATPPPPPPPVEPTKPVDGSIPTEVKVYVPIFILLAFGVTLAYTVWSVSKRKKAAELSCLGLFI